MTVEAPGRVGVGATKSWDPASQDFNPGDASTITLGATNTSNMPVDSLVIQDPVAAVEGATELDASNAFTITDLSALSGTAPEGATAVQVDAYVKQGDGSYAWQTGTPAADPTLPAGVDPADVAGLRATWTGEIVPGATAGLNLALGQRATDRDTDADLSTATHRVDNVASATANREGFDSVSDDAKANYTVTPASLGVSTTKNIQPNRMGAGETATATITATNEDSVVSELRVADLDYFTDDITFGGFTDGIAWPADTTAAKVVYHPLDGGAPVDVSFGNGALPTPPADAISGFELVFTGAIVTGEPVDAKFTIETAESATGDAREVTTTNTVDAMVTAPNGLTAEASDSDTLTLIRPGIDVILNKSVRPSAPVEPGQSVVTRLDSRTTTTSSYVTNTKIVVEDVWAGGDDEFWNVFNLAAIAPTQVPAGATLTIDAFVDGAWTQLIAETAGGGPALVSMTTSEINAALVPDSVADVTGLRFTFDNADGFAADTTVTPYFVSTARDELRNGAEVPEEATAYENTATTSASGTTTPGTPVEGDDTGIGDATVLPGTGVGVTRIDKEWSEPTVPAQTSSERGTTLSWRVDFGFETVSITDPAEVSNTGESVFNAFDLVGIDPIDANNDPFSNGWFLMYDTIDAVELYRDGAWVTVTEPGDGWIQNGSFVGYTLTDDERADTTGSRLVLSENRAARVAAGTSGAYDPYAPKPDTGVATSSASRNFALTWELRNKTRVGDDWVTEKPLYNTGDEGAVENTVELEAVPADGDPSTSTGADTILITNPGPGVAVNKAVEADDPIFVPVAGTPADGYPTASWTITGQNDSVARASYVRITDPAPCEDTADVEDCQGVGTAAGALADPFADRDDWLTNEAIQNSFERFDIQNVTIAASITDQVDLDESVVWVLRYDAVNDTYSTQQTTAAAVNAMTADDLADAVGLSVAYQGTDPATTGGTITPDNRLTISYDTQLRTTLRSTGENQVLGAARTIDVNNRVFAQSFDPILSDEVPTGDLAVAGVVLSGGDINVAPAKSVNPDSLLEPTRTTPVAVTLGANQGTDPRSTLSPSEVWLRDDITSSPQFWDAFDFTGLGDIVAPQGADQVTVSVFGPFGADDALEWVASDATPIGDAVVPVAADDYGEIQGIQLSFTRTDGEFFSPQLPAPNWSTATEFTAVLRDTQRDSGEPVVMSGSVDNTVTVQSVRPEESSEEKQATATIDLASGTHELKVNKLANEGRRLVNAGQNVPWDLTFTNAGTGFLTVTELRDLLPGSLVHLGDPAPTFTGDDDGSLSEDVTVAQEGQELIFTWPEDGNRMKPGETFTIRLHLELQPGLRSGERATNTMTVKTAETLDTCSNINPDAGTTGAWGDDDTSCGTTDYVSPTEGPNLFTIKGVRGQLEGATNPSNVGQTCQQNLDATGGSYFRSPCAANSVVGGTDDWVLRAINAGTTDVDELTIFDALPVDGDTFLVSGTSRGSVYRPQLLDTLEVNAPGGVEIITEVTTSADVCQGTWGNLTNQEPCEQNGESWAVADGDTDWSVVTGVRVKADFTKRAGEPSMAPGEFVDVTFSTKNMPATDDDPTGAPKVVPVEDTLAWNQFGVKYRDTGATAHKKIAPSRVGTHLPTGSIGVVKDITGPAAAYAADDFLVDVECSVEGVDLVMGDFGTLALNEANNYEARVDGIPVGSNCTVTEQGEIGEFGETSRGGTPTQLQVEQITGAEDALPTAQVANVTNDYQFSGLSLTKKVSTDADTGEFGPFTFALSCESATGMDVDFGDGVTDLEFTVEADETFTAPENTIPAGATCSVTETDTSAADEIVFVGDNVQDNGDGSAYVGVGTATSVVTVTNGYEAGTFVLTKMVEGDGADRFGTGPFTFDATCAYLDQILLDETFDLDPDGSRSFGTFPAGTACQVTEQATGGANATVIEPSTFLIAGPAEGVEGPGEVTVTATNTFRLGDLVLNKAIEGDGADIFGAGPFEAQVSCSYDRDGVDTDIDLPNDGLVQLSAANGYEHTIEGLLVGSTCTVEETATGGATGTSMNPEDGEVTIVGLNGNSVEVSLTNTFDVGSLDITKRVEGEGAELYGAGPFEVGVSCTYDVDGVETDTDLPNGGRVELNEDNEYSATLDNLLIGSRCVVEETATGGATSSSIVPEDGVVTITGTDGDSAEVVVTNVFDVTSLQVTKALEGWDEGNFSVELECTMDVDGEDVEIDIPGGATRELSTPRDLVATYDDLPIGAACTLTETDADGANSTSIAVDTGGNEPVVVPSGSADITMPEGDASALVTNVYDQGELVVRKVVEGDGAELYGAGPFTFEAECEFRGRTLLDETFDLVGDESARFGTYPSGTVCSVTEQATGGANTTVVEPGTVTIEGPAEGSEEPGEVTVTATNTFHLGSLAITKTVNGEGASLYGTGPFEAQVVCTYDVDGEETDVSLPEDGLVELSADNDYTTTIDDLLVGTSCVVEETATGGATSSSLLPEDGVVTIEGPDADPAKVMLVNTFDVTSLQVTKAVEGQNSGTFAVELECTMDVDGEETAVDIPGGAKRELSAPDNLVGTYDNLPVDADCTLTETDTGGAESTTISVVVGEDDPAEVKGTSAQLVLHSDAQVKVTNTFTPPTPTEPGEPTRPGGALPNAGGPRVWLLIVGLLATAGGAAVLVNKRRRA